MRIEQRNGERMCNSFNNFFLWTYFRIQITDKNDTILEAICEKAYGDATAQGAFNTLLTTTALKEQASESKEIAIKTLRNALSSFAESTDNFDSWHDDLCEKIKGCYKGGINDSIIDRFSYGNAQKLVNMAMKYLYLLSEIAECFSDKDIKELLASVKIHSEDLHIPIDSFIIDAIWRETDLALPLQDNTSVKRDRKDYKTPSDNVRGWSTWDEGTYKSVQSDLLNYVKAQKKQPLEWESEMWIREAKSRKKE